MMSSTFGAPLGGTTVIGQYGFESLASSLITPPNGAGGGGSCLPSMVVVALGEPGTPVICCAATGVAANATSTRVAATRKENALIVVFIWISPHRVLARAAKAGILRRSRAAIF